MQAIEILPVALREGRIVAFRPDCAGSFVVGWPAGERPEEVAARALRGLDLVPIVLHSTSWRHAGGEVVLTYVAVVGPDAATPESWKVEPVGQVELARGDATRPPSSIDVAQVLEHALRHVAWLMKDDAVVRDELDDWEKVMEAYVPEPFRALGGPS